MKYKLDDYLNNLRKTSCSLSDLIDVDKVLKNVDEIEINLNTLNYIITNSQDDFYHKIDFLFKKHPHCFESIFILAAVRLSQTNCILDINDCICECKNFIESCDGVKKFFVETGLEKLILSGKIKNFVDYVTGVEVGLDSNARKNRYGSKIEKILVHNLKNIFGDNSNVKIYEQLELKDIKKGKVFDIVIENTKTNEKFLIESSFYNHSGSKIQETARSYSDIYAKIEGNQKVSFIWLADGLGMKSIQKFLTENYSKGYILNHQQFFECIKDLVLKNKDEK